MRDSTMELIALVMLFSAIAFVYYAFILKPRDEALYSIMECMGEDNSRSAYEACVTRLSP